MKQLNVNERLQTTISAMVKHFWGYLEGAISTAEVPVIWNEMGRRQ